MSRAHVVLGCSLLGIAGLAGVARVLESRHQPAAAVATAPAATEPSRQAEVALVAPSTTHYTTTLTEACTIGARLRVGDVSEDVECLEVHLAGAGWLTGVWPDPTFDADTEASLQAFQEHHGLVADGMVGPQTARALGMWAPGDVAPPDASTCPAAGHAAVVDRFNQRAWLCDAGRIATLMPITSAWSQPDPGTYEVYAKDLDAESSFSGEISRMTHFVAFTYGENQGARIAFHSIPTYLDGNYVQSLDSVGTVELQGDSSGCIRVLPDDAARIWDWLAIGDLVTVVS